ncbi:MAG: SDR family oxidoreductase, partial [Planctomycetes bacterium]|nr:SDR family oxidoreductase [Planctomycetota bacterium]
IVAEAKTRMSEEEHWEYWRSNIPMDRLIQPKEVGDLCVFLLSDRASAITGTDMVVDAGMCAQLISTDLKR